MTLQGGLDRELRDISLRDLTARDLPGYAIGGLAGGEDKSSFWRVVAQCTAALPKGKPRYVMGIGYPVDIVVCSALGADMYDSVFPTRTARFGVALVGGEGGTLKLKKKEFAGAGPAVREVHTCAPRPCCTTHVRRFRASVCVCVASMVGGWDKCYGKMVGATVRA